MKLQKLDSTIPIKAIPEQELNKTLLTTFLTWISGLLSLTDETSAERLEIALPAIKEHCWSMGFAEIKKMFEMYVDNKLDIKPKSNYFDRALLGQIVESYKKQKPKKKMDETEFKRQQDIMDAITHYDYFLANDRLDPNCAWVYTFLQSRELIQDSKKDKIFAFNRAKEMPNITNEEDAKIYAKKHLLRRYFEKIQAKGKHLKDLL